MKITFVALFALASASVFPQTLTYAQAPAPYIQVPIQGIPGYGHVD